VRYRRGAVDRLGLAGRLSVQRRMILRGIVGRPLRAGLTTLGIALSVPIIIISLFWNDALDHVVEVQFGAAERADMTVIFTDPLPGRAERAIARMPGVLTTEAVRGVPVRLRHGHRTYRTAISGLPPDARLRRLLDRDQHVVPLPADGLLLSRRLGERLAIEPGEHIVIKVLEAERPTREVPVAGLVDDMIGLGAYMDIRALHRLMREADAITAVALLHDGSPPEAFYRAVKAVPKVQTVAVKALSLQLFRETVATLILVMAGVLSLFSAAIAIGVVYNNARIVLHERAWELASLRVLGFTRAEVSRLLLSEIAVEVLVAVPFGLWLGYWLARGLVAMNEIETFQIPVVIAPHTYAAAAAIVLLAGAASALIVRRRIDRLDLVGVLKARE
jgi:putative ABC transport system permease protein